MRRRFELHIDRPPALVWEWLTYPSYLPKWRSGCVDVRPVEELLVADMPSVRVCYEREGRSSVTVETLLASKPPEQLQLGVDHPLFHLLLTYNLRVLDEATLLHCTYDLRIKNLWVQLFWPTIRSHAATELERDHYQLKHLLETEHLPETVVASSKPVRLN